MARNLKIQREEAVLAFGNPINNAILQRGEWQSKLALHLRM